MTLSPIMRVSPMRRVSINISYLQYSSHCVVPARQNGDAKRIAYLSHGITEVDGPSFSPASGIRLLHFFGVLLGSKPLDSEMTLAAGLQYLPISADCQPINQSLRRLRPAHSSEPAVFAVRIAQFKSAVQRAHGQFEVLFFNDH